MDLQALAAELTAGHPDTGAYDADDAIAATQINVVNRTTPKGTLTGSEVNHVSRAVELGLGNVRVGDVQRARA